MRWSLLAVGLLVGGSAWSDDPPAPKLTYAEREKEMLRLVKEVFKDEVLAQDQATKIYAELDLLDIFDASLYLAPLITGARHGDARHELGMKIALRFVPQLKPSKEDEPPLTPELFVPFKPHHVKFRAFHGEMLKNSPTIKKLANQHLASIRDLTVQIVNAETAEAANQAAGHLIQLGEEICGLNMLSAIEGWSTLGEEKVGERQLVCDAAKAVIYHYYALDYDSLRANILKGVTGGIDKRNNPGTDAWRGTVQATVNSMRDKMIAKLKVCPYNKILLKSYSK